jgi:hypothetical protein
MEARSLPAELRNALAHAIFRANVELWETVRKRTLGKFSEPPTVQHAQPVQPNGTTTPSIAGPLLSQVLPGFLDFMLKQEGWRGQTLAQNRATYDMFVQCCGDKPVTEYERKDLAAFYDLLRALPKLYSKSAEWRGLFATARRETERTPVRFLSSRRPKGLRRSLACFSPCGYCPHRKALLPAANLMPRHFGQFI